jgi:hypothetical protein
MKEMQASYFHHAEPLNAGRSILLCN